MCPQRKGSSIVRPIKIFSRTRKNRSKDTLPLNQMALKVLKPRARKQNDSGYIFYNGNGGKLDDGNLRRSFYASVENAKISHLRFHDLRHTFATSFVQAGEDINGSETWEVKEHFHGNEVYPSLP